MLDSTKERILRNPEERKKLQAELKARQAEIGVRDMIGLKGQNEFEVLEDLKNNAGKIEDEMAATKARQAARERAERAEEDRRRQAMDPEIYARLAERKEREEYERRKIKL